LTSRISSTCIKCKLLIVFDQNKFMFLVFFISLTCTYFHKEIISINLVGRFSSQDFLVSIVVFIHELFSYRHLLEKLFIIIKVVNTELYYSSNVPVTSPNCFLISLSFSLLLSSNSH
jgi:hypothetical protein